MRQHSHFCIEREIAKDKEERGTKWSRGPCKAPSGDRHPWATSWRTEWLGRQRPGRWAAGVTVLFTGHSLPVCCDRQPSRHATAGTRAHRASAESRVTPDEAGPPHVCAHSALRDLPRNSCLAFQILLRISRNRGS